MNPKRSPDYSMLPKESRRVVFFARLACHDTWHGGCRAWTWAEEQDADYNVMYAIDETYARSSGRPADECDAWECGECGSVHFGREAAEGCCAACYDDADDPDRFDFSHQ